MIALLAVALVAGQVGTSSGAVGRLGTRPFSVEAERLETFPKERRYRAEGDVIVRRGDATLLADVVVFDERTGIATAEGNVTAIDGVSVLTCKKVEMKIPELVGGIEQGELRIKSKSGAKDELIIGAERMERLTPHRFEIEGGSFTPCDCGEDANPTWRIESSEASVDLQSGAWMKSSLFYVYEVPVFWLPIMYVPLGSRRTGLLAPRPSNTPVTGPSIRLPFFIAMGPSWDSTIEAMYMSSRGPGLGLELRYTPTTDSAGTWNLTNVLDFGDPDGEGGFSKTRSFADGEPSPLFRTGLTGRHVTQFDPVKLHIGVDALTDPRFISDFGESFLQRQVEWTRSRATVTHASDLYRIAATAQWLQDLRSRRYADPDQRETSLFSKDVPGAGATRQRVFELRLDAVPYALPTPFPLIGDAGFSLAAFGARSRSLTRFARADFRPAVSAPIDIMGLVVEPYVAARVTAWAGSTRDDSVASNRQAVLAGGRVFMELSRLYDDVFHVLRPSVEYRAVPWVSRRGDDVFETFDEIDLLAEVSQARLRLQSELLRNRDGLRLAGLDVWFGGDLGLPGGGSAGASEVVVEPSAAIAPEGWPVRFGFDGLLAYDLDGRGLTELFARGSVNVLEDYALTVAYAELPGDGPPRYTFIAPEELVPSRTIDRTGYVALADLGMRTAEERRDLVPWSAFRGLSLGTRVRPIDEITVAFDMTLSFLDRVAAYGSTEPPSVIRSTRTMVRVDLPCDCFSAWVTAATARDREGFSFDFGIDLARLGSISSN
ncbi:MAG: hypothetical protein RMA76_08035 [Deltaproteobacteria bacterium]